MGVKETTERAIATETGCSARTPSDVRIIAPNLKRRFSGVTASIIAVVPALARLCPIRVLGPGIPPNLPTITWREFLTGSRKGPWRIWHARRNVEMLVGILLRKLLRYRLILIWTSAAQRHHTRYTRLLYGRMDRVIATTAAAASFLGRSSVVVHHGVDTTNFRPPADRRATWKAMNGPGEFGIGIFGRIRPQKGTEEFIDALCAVLPSLPRWGAVLIGETTPRYRSFRHHLERKIERAGLKDRVVFVGKVEDFADIPRWYQAMTLVVVPPWIEGFGLTCLEAMASGCAVVASQTGAFPEVVQPGWNGWLVPCRDAAALRDTLGEVLGDPEHLEEVGARAHDWVENHFTIEREAEKIAKVYEETFAEFSSGPRS